MGYWSVHQIVEEIVREARVRNEITARSDWAPALINDDFSGVSKSDMKYIRKILRTYGYPVSFEAEGMGYCEISGKRGNVGTYIFVR